MEVLNLQVHPPGYGAIHKGFGNCPIVTHSHVVEPKYPGVVEQYVNLGKCYDRDGLEGLRPAIISCMRGYKGHYQRAYRCLDAAAELMCDIRSTLDSDALEEKLSKRARGILARELKPRKGAAAGTVKQRFLGAVTHRGQMCLWGTAECQCQRVYELSDRYGLAHRMLAHLLSGALKAGYDVVACPSPMAPDRLEHLLIPQLSLAFLSSSPARPYPGKTYRRILLDNAVPADLLRRSRPRLRFSQKIASALMDEAVDSLSQAKAMHDDLEALYHPYVNFDLVDETALAIAAELSLL